MWLLQLTSCILVIEFVEKIGSLGITIAMRKSVLNLFDNGLTIDQCTINVILETTFLIGYPKM